MLKIPKYLYKCREVSCPMLYEKKEENHYFCTKYKVPVDDIAKGKCPCWLIEDRIVKKKPTKIIKQNNGLSDEDYNFLFEIIKIFWFFLGLIQFFQIIGEIMKLIKKSIVG